MKFKDYAEKGICECCGKETDVVVCCSRIAPMSFAYCKDCYCKGIEPYWIVVTDAMSVGKFPEAFAEEYVKYYRMILDFYNKTDDEFNKDVEEAERKMWESVMKGDIK